MWASKCFASVKQEWKCLEDDSKHISPGNTAGMNIIFKTMSF
jgi:hypothetical protein